MDRLQLLIVLVENREKTLRGDLVEAERFGQPRDAHHADAFADLFAHLRIARRWAGLLKREHEQQRQHD